MQAVATKVIDVEPIAVIDEPEVIGLAMRRYREAVNVEPGIRDNIRTQTEWLAQSMFEQGRFREAAEICPEPKQAAPGEKKFFDAKQEMRAYATAYDMRNRPICDCPVTEIKKKVNPAIKGPDGEMAERKVYSKEVVRVMYVGPDKVTVQFTGCYTCHGLFATVVQ